MLVVPEPVVWETEYLFQEVVGSMVKVVEVGEVALSWSCMEIVPVVLLSLSHTEKVKVWDAPAVMSF